VPHDGQQVCRAPSETETDKWDDNSVDQPSRPPGSFARHRLLQPSLTVRLTRPVRNTVARVAPG
jgi:hypothetical protein